MPFGPQAQRLLLKVVTFFYSTPYLRGLPVCLRGPRDRAVCFCFIGQILVSAALYMCISRRSDAPTSRRTEHGAIGAHSNHKFSKTQSPRQSIFIGVIETLQVTRYTYYRAVIAIRETGWQYPPLRKPAACNEIVERWVC